VTPRLTLRTQLTLLYAGPFIVSGVALLGVQLLDTEQTTHGGTPGGAPADLAQGPGLHELPTASVVVLAGMVVVSLVLGWLIAGRFLRPLRTITSTARAISASNLHRRLGRSGRSDELAELAETLDELFARLEASFDSQRHFVANAAHELRTPLTTERTVLQVALADPHATADTLRSACREVLALGETQERLVNALLTLASSERGIERREPLDLADVARELLRARRQEARRLGIGIDATLAPAPTAGDPDLAESLVANLVDNALRHNAAGGGVEVATGTVAGRARIAVRNTGPVIPSDQVERLFQPFQRLGAGRVRRPDGHGLGLAIVQAIANAHRAALVPRARPEGGLEVEVTFPEV
jgi:signal transduction histidine kinase